MRARDVAVGLGAFLVGALVASLFMGGTPSAAPVTRTEPSVVTDDHRAAERVASTAVRVEADDILRSQARGSEPPPPSPTPSPWFKPTERDLGLYQTYCVLAAVHGIGLPDKLVGTKVLWENLREVHDAYASALRRGDAAIQQELDRVVESRGPSAFERLSIPYRDWQPSREPGVREVLKMGPEGNFVAKVRPGDSFKLDELAGKQFELEAAMCSAVAQALQANGIELSRPR